MPVADAQALLAPTASPARFRRRASGAVHFAQHDPRADREALQKLAWSCLRFSPLVGVEESEAPESLLLDITGCSHLFGGEEGLAKAVQQYFRRRKFSVYLGVAETIGVAWAAAHYGESINLHYRRKLDPRLSSTVVLIPPGQSEHALRPLPIEALRLAPKVADALNALDVRRIDQLLALPRGSLPARFGPELLRRLDQALGAATESIVPERPPEPIEADWSFEFPTADRRAIETVSRKLIERLFGQLVPRDQGVETLLCRLESAGSKPMCVFVKLLRPSASIEHLWQLLSLRLERLALPEEVSRVHVRMAATASLESRQRRLFESERHDDWEEFATLVERLASRLGARSVFRPILQPDAQPEYAIRHQPLLDGSRFSPPAARQSREEPDDVLLARPLCLKREPIAVDVLAVVPEGPPYRFHWNGREHRIAQSWGPERITTGWWRARSIGRDYFRVQTEDGQRFWLFREISTGAWFLHGVFE